MIAADGFGAVLLTPHWLWATLPLLLVHGWLVRRSPRLPLATAGGPELRLARLPKGWRARLRWLPWFGEALAILALVLALAQPVQRRPKPPEPPGRDLLLCVDRSSSMAADDLQPGRTRLSVGIELLGEFVRLRQHDRLGLVAFARYADLRCPPTGDHTALLELLQGTTMVAKDGPEDATAIGAATALAGAVLRRSPARAKVVVLVTDGEENVAGEGDAQSIAPLHAAQLCAASGVRVHTIVVGRGNQRADGTWAPLDTTAVQQLATTTGGRSFEAQDRQALANVCAAIDELEALPWAPPGVEVQALFPWAIAAGLLALALAWLGAVWLRRPW